MNKDIATKIKTLRAWEELTQAEFGKKIGVSTTSISSWESGHSQPSYENAAKIRQVFDVNFDSFYVVYDSSGKMPQ